MAQAGTSEQPNNGAEASIRLEDLFDSSRILVKPKLYKAVFYFPFALFLLLTRLIAVIFAFSILSLLPKASPKRSVVLKGLCRILGIVVEVDDKYNDENAKLLVANHVSLWDRLAVNAMVPCCSITKDFQIRNTDTLSFWNDSDIPFPREYTTEEVGALQRCIEGSSARVLHFPECATTNGKIGLLKFHPGVFSVNAPIQPQTKIPTFQAKWLEKHRVNAFSEAKFNVLNVVITSDVPSDEDIVSLIKEKNDLIDDSSSDMEDRGDTSSCPSISDVKGSCEHFSKFQ
ncbi:hypothetical protein AVEN_128437-1 [Araneus ventricosus]|uniref:Phospholipid/glycerol acyltransferase domain-containing protein n=1 Tax=Araneus ventricosus TaxID=182803 RepID=A0A4Y2GHE4_ARAVE|nr:hypothetical protein AVEN_128437-1 [Araneus ventricosus]